MADKGLDPLVKLLAQFNSSSQQKSPAPKSSNGVMVGGTFVPLPEKKPDKPMPTVSRDAILAQFNASSQQKAPSPKLEYSPFISADDSNSITATPPTVTPPPAVAAPPAPAVKTAETNDILFDQDDYPEQLEYDLLYEDISSQELISISRSDIINGQKILYQPIKNLSSIQQQYNPNNILSLQQTSNTYFAGFSINLDNKIPSEGNGLNGENIYINSAGELIIELINLNPDEQVEIQIALSGTIYEANLGDYTS